MKYLFDSLRIFIYRLGGKKPWSVGYYQFKWRSISKAISNAQSGLDYHYLPHKFGHRLDERIVEYLWAFTNFSTSAKRTLDAGSAFNYRDIVAHPFVQNPNHHTTIFTYAKENNVFNQSNIAYDYGDLREMTFEDGSFDQIISISTIEHIDMDNSIYGYDVDNSSEIKEKSYDYLKAVNEMNRLTKSGGTILITFPYGAYKNYGFFQQFDSEMVSKLAEVFQPHGSVEMEYFQYHPSGWQLSTAENCQESVSFNPHTGEGEGDDGAAHCRAVCCVKFIKA